MSPTIQTYSPEETLRLLSDAAAAKGDRFVVKLFRAKGLGGLLENFATLADATLLHIANPETWVPSLAGGGEVAMSAAHMDASGERIGGFFRMKYAGAPYEHPNTSALRMPGWQGPQTLVFPMSDQQFAQNPSFVTGLPTMNLNQLPSAQFQPGPTAQPQFNPSYQQASQWEREALAARERALAEKQAALDRQLLDREHELKEREREAKLRDEMAAKQRELDAKLNEMKQGSGNTKELIVALVPLVLGFINQQAEARREAAKLSEESNRLAREAAAKQSEAMMAMVMKMGENKGMSPEVAMMLEMLKNQSSGSAEMMSRMVEAMGTVSKTSVGMIEAIADIQLGGAPEHPVLAAVKEGVRALSSLSHGAQSGARRVVQQQQAQTALPPGRPAQQPAPAQQAQQPAQAKQPAPTPAPNMPPASEAPVAQQQAAFAGIDPQKPGTPALIEGQVVETLKALIIGMHEPVEEVAAYFIEAVQKSQEMKDALAQFDGDLNKLFSEHLGMWLITGGQPARDYLGKLGPIIDQMATDAGIGVEEDGGEEQPEA